MEAFFVSAASNAVGTLMADVVKKPLEYLPRLFGDRVGNAPLPNLEFSKYNDLVASKPYTYAFNEIMDALKKDRVNTIGVWGMGGVGKTTLVTDVGHTAKALQFFHKVIKVVVSQTSDIGKIQDKIADSLELKFEKKTEEGKAGELWQRLEKEKVLIILDDLWEELNLKKIGIPFDKISNCKIILTTRLKRVCKNMESQVTVSLGVLEKDEAWNLFKTKASFDEDNADAGVIRVAKEVAEECGGLPVAIVTLASALRGAKTVRQWEAAHYKLKNCRLPEIRSIEGKEKNAYMCLKTSYDYLRSEATKRCFLLCGLYPEDHSIDAEELVRFAWGLELYPKATSIENARLELFEDIEHLKDSCLLLEDDGVINGEIEGERYVKLHDVVRDVAQWIASNEQLEILLHHDYDNKTPIDNFEGKQALKVLSLNTSKKPNNVFSLNVLKSLPNLRALQLIGFEQIEDISSLAKLTRLEILHLHGSRVQETIDNLGELKNLKVLDMRKCDFLLGFPPNLIRRFVGLEELYIYGSSTEKIGVSILSELNLLPKLAALSLEIPSLQLPQDFLFAPRLRRYQIALNTKLESDLVISPMRYLSISKGKLLLKVISELLRNVEFLAVSDIMEKEIKYLTDTTPGDVPVATILQNLKGVKIEDCENVQVIFKVKKAENHTQLLSELIFLGLEDLPDLEYIWKVPTQHISLRSLVVVKLIRCGKLKSVFSFSLAQCLICLDKLEIEDCDELQQIVEEISPTTNLETPLCLAKLRSLKIKDCDSLEYIFPKFMAPQGLPQLKKLGMDSLSRLKQIQRPAKKSEENVDILLLPLQLTKLRLIDCPELTDATIHSKMADLKRIQLSKLEGSLINTKYLEISEIMDDHYNLVPGVNREGLNELIDFQLHHCHSVEYLVDTTKEEHAPDTAFAKLVELLIFQMKGLKRLCNGKFPKRFLQNLEKLTVSLCAELEVFQIDENLSKGSPPYFNLQSLKFVKVFRCRKLKSLFSLSLIQSLKMLEKLEIEHCDELKTVFAEQENDGTEPSSHDLHPLSLPRLITLSISGCASLEYVLPFTLAQAAGLPQLENFEIKSCGELKTLFEELKNHEGGETESSRQNLCLPMLITLCISDCASLKYVLPITWAQAGLPQLKNFEIKECGELEILFKELENDGGETESSSHPLCLPSLTTLSISKCARLEYGLPITLGQEGLPQLEKLEIEYCDGLKSVFSESSNHDLHPLCLPSLINLTITYCKMLHHVLPITFAQGLPQLERFVVFECFFSSHVFGGEKQHDRVKHRIELPCLTELILGHLVSLFIFGPKNFTFKSPALKKLIVARCPQLIRSPNQEFHLEKVLALDFEGLASLELTDCKHLKWLADTTKDNVPTCAIMFTNLIELGIKEMPDLKMLCNGPPPDGFLQNLEILTVEYCKDIVSLYPVAKNLKSLTVKSCGKLQELFGMDELLHSSRQGNQAPSLSNLESLMLTSVNDLKWILKGPVPTQYVSLRNLKVLKIHWCHNLKYLFSFSLVQSLRLLEEICISNCNELEMVFEVLETEDETESSNKLLAFAQIDLPRLQKLKLILLKNLSRFVPENYFIKAPALEDIEIICCPGLTNFSIQQDKPLQSKSKSKLPVPVPVPGGSKVMSSLKTMKLRDLIWVQDIWKGLIQVAALTNLVELEVNECNNLTYIFSPMLVRNLWQLKTLTIGGCEKVEQIIVDDDDLPSSSAQVPDKEILILFPQLRNLWLSDLPSFTRFSHMGYHLLFPRLNELKIKGCSLMITNFTASSMSSVHAKTKLPVLSGSKIMSSPKTIQLDCLIWQQDIRKGPIQVAALTNLARLEVNDCNNLTYIFSPMLVRNMRQLNTLKIMECKKVEQIIVDDDLSSSSTQGDHDKEIMLMFPLLQYLTLSDLPSLTSFIPVGYHLLLSSLHELKIEGCSQMITSFTVDSMRWVYAKTKAPPVQDDTTPSRPDIYWTIYSPTSLPAYVEEADEI